MSHNSTLIPSQRRIQGLLKDMRMTLQAENHDLMFQPDYKKSLLYAYQTLLEITEESTCSTIKVMFVLHDGNFATKTYDWMTLTDVFGHVAPIINNKENTFIAVDGGFILRDDVKNIKIV